MAIATNGGPSQVLTPPHNLNAEVSVLGAMLLSERAIYGLVIETGLRPEDFYRDHHRTIYAAILELYDAGESVDALTVTDRLKQNGRLEDVGGAAAVDSLAAAVPSAGHARRYAEIVKESALLRRLLIAGYEIQASVHARDGEPREIVERAERAILEVAYDDRSKDFAKIEEILHRELQKLERLSREGTALTGVPSGFKDLDEITGGFQPGNLIVLASRPAMGKSSMVANFAENAAIEHGKAVALFSLEMAEAELAQRFVASQARIKGNDLSKGRVRSERWPKILQASQRLAAAPLYVDDSSDVGLLDLRAKARRLHDQRKPEGLGLIIVDYLQLMRTDHRVDNRAEQVGQLSRGLKILARELDVPVIALSQLNRGVEARSDKVPLLSDLRESGSIEQDADLVMFIYRDDYYDEDSERQGEADLIIAKHRNGAVGKVTLTFQPEYPKFSNMASPDRYGA
jgi:replicative DNA helicase